MRGYYSVGREWCFKVSSKFKIQLDAFIEKKSIVFFRVKFCTCNMCTTQNT